MRALAKSHGPWKWWMQGQQHGDSTYSLNPVERKAKQPDAATVRRQYKAHYAARRKADVSVSNPPQSGRSN